MMTAFAGKGEAAQLLIDYKADVNAKDEKGSTALHYASASHIDLVRLLLKNGADPDIKSNDGVSPLFVAALNGRNKIVKLLLESSPIDENEQKELTNYKLHFVCLSDRDTGEVDLKELQRLLAAGADINHYMTEG